MSDGPGVIFHEEQKFHQWWVWAIVVVVPLIVLVVFGFGMVQQLVSEKSEIAL